GATPPEPPPRNPTRASCVSFSWSVSSESPGQILAQTAAAPCGGTAPLASGFSCSLHTELALIATVNLLLACNLCMLSLPSPWIETEAMCGEDQEVHRECEAVLPVCMCVRASRFCARVNAQEHWLCRCGRCPPRAPTAAPPVMQG